MDLSLNFSAIHHSDNLFVFNVYMVLFWIVTHLGVLHIFWMWTEVLSKNHAENTEDSKDNNNLQWGGKSVTPQHKNMQNETQHKAILLIWKQEEQKKLFIGGRGSNKLLLSTLLSDN